MSCRTCHSEDLFSGWFDAEDLAYPIEATDTREVLAAAAAAGVRWTTFCMSCGSEWKAPRARKSAKSLVNPIDSSE